jgi:hypothetical protein
VRGDGEPWKKSHQHRPFREACKQGKLPREFIFYSLRHYFISQRLLAGMNVIALDQERRHVGRNDRAKLRKICPSDVRDALDQVAVASS